MIKKMKIRLSNKFYDKDIVKEALNDFKEVCSGKVINDEIDVELDWKESEEEIDKEFCNYVLGLMKNKNLV